MAITIKDVAKAAGVSVSTVSKILNNSGSISQNTIKLSKFSYYRTPLYP